LIRRFYDAVSKFKIFVATLYYVWPSVTPTRPFSSVYLIDCGDFARFNPINLKSLVKYVATRQESCETPVQFERLVALFVRRKLAIRVGFHILQTLPKQRLKAALQGGVAGGGQRLSFYPMLGTIEVERPNWWLKNNRGV